MFALRTSDAKGAAPRVASQGQLFGTGAELEALVGPLASAGTPTRVSVVERTFIGAVRHFGGGTVERRPFAAKSGYATAPLQAAGIDVLVRAAEARHADARLGNGGILLDSYGGAIGRVAAGETAFVHRDALFSLQALAYWRAGDAAGRVRANLAWLRDLERALRPHLSGQAYQNYADPELAGWARAYYGSNLERLVAVKKRYDPGNLFRFAQSIPPRL